MHKPLSQQQLQKLNEHKYNATGKSLTEPLFQIFWNWLVEKCPLWVAPNLMTLTGLVLNVLSVVVLLIHSPAGISEIPAISLVIAALCLFIYQTLDALDGKQARRTSTSSPLGELFDHGCDSFSTVFVTLGTTVAVGMGSQPYMMFLQVAIAVILFYMAHWQCYVTGAIRFGHVDVTEAQASVMIIYILTAIYGVDFWSRKMPVLGIEYKEFQFLLMAVFALIMFVRFTITIMRGGAGRNGATVANTSVLFPIAPLGLVMLLAGVIASQSPSHVFHNYPCLYLASFGLISSKITNKLVVAHMTKSEISLLDTSLFGPLALFLNQYFRCPIEEYWILLFCCLYTTWDGIKYATCVCIQIAEYLELYIFSTKRPPISGQTKNKKR